MALQSSGAISLSNIQTEFGGSNPISLSEYYKGGTYVPSTVLRDIVLTNIDTYTVSGYEILPRYYNTGGAEDSTVDEVDASFSGGDSVFCGGFTDDSTSAGEEVNIGTYTDYPHVNGTAFSGFFWARTGGIAYTPPVLNFPGSGGDPDSLLYAKFSLNSQFYRDSVSGEYPKTRFTTTLTFPSPGTYKFVYDRYYIDSSAQNFVSGGGYIKVTVGGTTSTQTFVKTDTGKTITFTTTSEDEDVTLEYYSGEGAGGGYVGTKLFVLTNNDNDQLSVTVNSSVPTSGTIEMSDFYGGTKT